MGNVHTGVFKKRNLLLIILFILLGLALVWSLMPIIWMFLSSLKRDASMFTMPPKFIFKPDFHIYRFMFSNKGNFGQFMVNSLIAAVSSTVIALFFGSMGGYALARGKFKRKSDISFWIISTRMAPIPAVILPVYLIFAKLHLVGSMAGLIYAYTTFNLPFALWMMMIFFKEVPTETEEAANVDGCSKFQTFIHIAIPMATPGLVATGVLCMMFAWNDYMFASVLTGTATQTIPVSVSLLVTQTGIVWGQVMAMGTIIVLPIMIAGFVVRKYLVRGLSMGAIK